MPTQVSVPEPFLKVLPIKQLLYCFVLLLCISSFATNYSSADEIKRFCNTGTQGIQWSPDSQYFAQRTFEGGIIYRQDFTPYKFFSEECIAVFMTSDEYTSCTGKGIAWNNDSTLFAIPYYGENASPGSMWIGVWELESNTIIGELPVDGYDNTEVLWSPDGTKIATTSRTPEDNHWKI